MERSHKVSLIWMHLVVLIYGFTAILGKLIEMQALQMVWYRMAFAAMGLFVYLIVRNKPIVKIPFKETVALLGIGLVVASHWIAFFHAIKISNISVTLGVISSGALFASILEPLFFKKKIDWLELLIGIFIILGLYIIFSYELEYLNGIIVAIVATVLATVFTILNKKYTTRYPPTIISFYEMLGGFIGISVYMLFSGGFESDFIKPSTMDFVYLLILGLICTAFAFALSVDVMKELSAYTVILSINMEPIYGILLAFLIFGESEYMTWGFYVGAAIILASVFLYPLLKRRRVRKIRSIGL
ncbi:EamA-like transporter family protein [Saccharicrinis carchari]|uniref:EamA-like transporter family protein n=1 Tax=Saccharicrinis carchari TaxID=1168039 RepID=A0A521B6J3_SACCC|nr:DMT family transporter [Saccharicrinis carchari]SMO42685.1 EamA-like transporter family protein [Saccharicrinis carchari]